MLDEYLIQNNDNYREWRGAKTEEKCVTDTDTYDEMDIFDEEIEVEWESQK